MHVLFLNLTNKTSRPVQGDHWARQTRAENTPTLLIIIVGVLHGPTLSAGGSGQRT